jgi:hypothetical protein
MAIGPVVLNKYFRSPAGSIQAGSFDAADVAAGDSWIGVGPPAPNELWIIRAIRVYLRLGAKHDLGHYGTHAAFANGVVATALGSVAPIGDPAFSIGVLGYFMESNLLPFKKTEDWFRTVFHPRIDLGETFSALTLSVDYDRENALKLDGAYAHSFRLVFGDVTTGLLEHTALVSINQLSRQ